MSRFRRFPAAPFTEAAYESERMAAAAAGFGAGSGRLADWRSVGGCTGWGGGGGGGGRGAGRERRKDSQPVRMRESLTLRRETDVERMIKAVLPNGLMLAAAHLLLQTGVRRWSSSFSPTAKGRFDLLLQPRNAADLCVPARRTVGGGKAKKKRWKWVIRTSTRKKEKQKPMDWDIPRKRLGDHRRSRATPEMNPLKTLIKGSYKRDRLFG